MSDYSLCNFSIKQLKMIAKDMGVPVYKKTKCELIILLDREGYGSDYVYYPSKKSKKKLQFKKQQKRMEYEVDDSDVADKLKYNLCLDRRNKLYSKSNEELKQKIKKRNPNFIIPSNLSQNKLIDELMYLDECNDLLPKNFSSKLEFIPEKIYMKPIRPNIPIDKEKMENELMSSEDVSIKPSEKFVGRKKPTIIIRPKKPEIKTNAFQNKRMEILRLERLSISELLDILYSRQYYPMSLINKLKTKEQLINAIMMNESDVLTMLSKL